MTTTNIIILNETCTTNTAQWNKQIFAKFLVIRVYWEKIPLVTETDDSNFGMIRECDIQLLRLCLLIMKEDQKKMLHSLCSYNKRYLVTIRLISSNLIGRTTRCDGWNGVV